jgi:hypothetical protein
MGSIIIYKDRFVTSNTPADILLEAGAVRVFEGGLYELNAIPQDRRKSGMICSINSGEAYFILKAQPWSYTNSDWEEIVITRRSEEIHFIDKETPTGVVDDMNMTFELQHQPIAESEHVYINGILQTAGDAADYVITSNQIVFNEAPFPGANIRCTYRYVNV